MAKKPPKPPNESEPAKRYPSRDRTKYVAIPLEEWAQLKALADEQDRSVSYMAKQAVRKLLAEVGRWPPPADQGGKKNGGGRS